MEFPSKIFSGYWPEGHVQGIAADIAGGYLYFSFTTILLKTDMAGNPVGSVKNLAGHLGCITFDSQCNRVYGSLELKHDAIGQGIINRTGWNPSQEDNFYLVSFDCKKIDRMGMDAEGDGVMLAVWLGDVARDYASTDPISGKPHIYGCSGIDGTGLGPVFSAEPDSPKKIMIAYGIYSDLMRTDNDHQVILQYDPSVFDIYGKSLNQSHPHHCGPDTCESRYFLYTGNTDWGVQNLEYDPFSHTWLVAVYPGKKPDFPNHSMFYIDGSVAPEEQPLTGRAGEQGLVLAHKRDGSRMELGSTGVCALGNGLYYFSKRGDNPDDRTFCSTVLLYQADPIAATGFSLVESQ